MNLKTRLYSSSAVKSLAAEQAIVHLLRENGWDVTHGSFFVDIASGKPRELDISATRHWTYPKEHQSSYLELKCEIKSASDYHLVFSPMIYTRHADLRYLFWLGNRQADVVEKLKEVNLPSQSISSIMGQVNPYINLPNGYIRPHKVIIPPFAARYRSTAFRETNIGVEKDLESSVLWKTLQTLDSVLDGSERDALAFQLSMIEGSLQFAQSTTSDLTNLVREAVLREMDTVHVFHPVIVIQAKLWFYQNSKLQPIDWCRFSRVPQFGDPDWCDIVSSTAAKSYFTKLTRYYDGRMNKLHAVRSLAD